jgi:hypothetical protein
MSAAAQGALNRISELTVRWGCSIAPTLPRARVAPDTAVSPSKEALLIEAFACRPIRHGLLDGRPVRACSKAEGVLPPSYLQVRARISEARLSLTLF